MPPLVSVVIPCYNRASIVERAVTGVLAQTISDLEVIVVDDASTDGSEAIEFGDERVRLLHQSRNQGPAAARNRGFKAAGGEFVAVLDSDDEWLPHKLERQLDTIRDADLSLCGYREVHPHGAIDILPPPDEDWRRRLHWQCAIAAGSTPLIRRTFLEQHLQDEQLRLLEDWEWLLRLCQNTVPAYVPEVLAIKHEEPRRPAPELSERCAQVFLERHDRDLARDGRLYRRWVRSKHFERIAEDCYRSRAFATGNGWLLRSFGEYPFQNPVRLGAIVASPIDGLFGTSIIERASAAKQRLGGKGVPPS